MFKHPAALLLRATGPSKSNVIQTLFRHCHVVVADQSRPAELPEQATFLPVANFDPFTVVEAWQRQGWVAPQACLTTVDPLTPTVAKIGQSFGCGGPDPVCFENIKDKLEFRRSLARAGFPQPEFHPMRPGDPAPMAYPFVLKPRHGAYGLGVNVIASDEELSEYWQRCDHELLHGAGAAFIEPTKERGWLAEGLLQGVEVSVEILGGERPRVIEIHEKQVSRFDGHFREDRFVTAPCELSLAEIGIVNQAAERLCRAVGFTHGVGSLEAYLYQGELFAVELQLCPTGGLIPEMVNKSRHYDILGAHALSYLGIPTEKSGELCAACAMEILHAPHIGRWRFSGIDRCAAAPGVFSCRILAQEPVVQVPHADYIGFVAARASTAPLAQEYLNAALRHLTLASLDL